MSKQNWALGVWAVTSVIAGSVAIAGLPQQNANDAGVGQPNGAIQRTDDANPNRDVARAGQGQHQDVDRFVAKCLIQANKDEIAAARLAQQRSTNQDVKQIANQMVEDHTKFLGKLEQFQNEHGGQNGQMRRRGADEQNRGNNDRNNGTLNNAAPGNNGVNNTQGNNTQGDNNTQGENAARGSNSQTQTSAPSNSNAVTQTNGTSSDTANDHNAKNEQRVNGTAGQQTTSTDQLTPPGTVDERGVAGRHFAKNAHGGMNAHAAAAHFVKIMEEVAQQNQQSMIRDLSQKEGVQFDRCYLHAQIFNHTWMVDALTVFQRNASSELQPILQEGLQTTQQHLTHAKALLMRIDQQAKTTASR